MSADERVELRGPLTASLGLLSSLAIPHIVVGGIAVSLLAQPRYTADVDLLAILESDDRLPALLARAGEFDMAPRLRDAEAFAREKRVLLLRHEPSQIGIDIALGLLPFEAEAVRRGKRMNFDGIELPLPTPSKT